MSNSTFVLLLVVVTVIAVSGQGQCIDSNWQCTSLRGHCRYYTYNRLYKFMNKNCRRTCGFCRTQAVHKACKNRQSYQSCLGWARRNYCHLAGSWRTFMKQNCAYSCGLCGNINNACVIKNVNCASWTRTGHCRRGARYYNYMTQNCRQTCGFCSVKKTPATKAPTTTTTTTTTTLPPPPITTTTTTTTTLPPPPLITTRATTRVLCQDLNEHCLTWATGKHKYCTQGNFIGYMKKNCKKSCGLCGTITTTRIPKPPVITTKPVIITTPRSTTTPKKRIITTTKITKPPVITTKSVNITTPRSTTTPKKPLSCGVKGSKISSFIVDGKTAHPHSWPWQTAHYLFDEFHCGGTLITEQYIITAAHCVEDREPEDMTVRVGDHKRDKDEGSEQTVNVDAYLIHEDYNSIFSYDNDIAIIRLAAPVKLNKKVNVACLPEEDKNVDLSSKCYISGWGKMRANESSVNVLQEAKLPLVSSEECGKRNKDKKGNSQITKNMLCAGEKSGTTSGCHGDSGGPFVCLKDGKWVLQGAVSWGSGKCENQHKYTVFARMSKYVKWIKENIA